MYDARVLLRYYETTITGDTPSGSANNVDHVTTWWQRRDHDFRRRIFWGKPMRQSESADRQRRRKFADDRVVPSHYAGTLRVQSSRRMDQVDPPIREI
jgi:hypothetical protein